MPAARTFLERAGLWFLHSGIQEASGGVARYYRTDVEKNAPVSVEITGYAVSALLYLNAASGEDEYLDAAVRAARFLTRSAWDGVLQTFPFESADGYSPRPPAYFFDCGIIVRGLLAAWRAANEEEFLEKAILCGHSMARDFVGKGSIHPILSLPDKQPVPYGATWSRKPGCYQLKAALAWHDLFVATRERRFHERYEEALRAALDSHDSFLPGTPELERVMDRLHAYCYFLEGLLVCAAQPKCGEVLEAGILRTSTWLREIGPVFARSDVYAQLLRLRLFADSLGVVPLDPAAAEEEARAVAEFQFEHDDRRMHGGFCFGRRGARLLPYVNPVSTVFCLQSLRMWQQHQAGEFQGDPQLLI